MNRDQAEAMLVRLTPENQRIRGKRFTIGIVLSDVQSRALSPIRHREPAEVVQIAALTDDELRMLLPAHHSRNFRSQGEAA